MRVGHGFDVHELEAGKPLILCGVKIPHTHGLKAYSDGDVAIHALCDAMLGAATLGDIGQHFPDTDKKNLNRNSKDFLFEINKLLLSNSYSIVNVDVTILAEKPKLSEHIFKMRKSLADVLQINIDAINVKATTTEGLGSIGKERGVAAHAVVSIA